MSKKMLIWALGGLAWMSAGAWIGFALDFHRPPPAPPYEIQRLNDYSVGPRMNKSEDVRVVCVKAPDGGRSCFANALSDEEATIAAHGQFVEDKDVVKAFWYVFTLAPPAFIFLVLWLIHRSGGMPGGFKKLEEENFPPRPR
jgi:hypothetical protein